MSYNRREMWPLFAILNAVTMAAVNILDKFVLTRANRGSVAPLLILVAMGLAPIPAIALVNGVPPLGARPILLAAGAALAYVLATLFYFAAARREEISRVVPLSYLSPLFVSLPAALFLGEVFPPAKYAGVALLVAGALAVSARDKISFRPSGALSLMILSALFMAGYFALTKRLLAETDFWTAFGLSRLGMFVVMLPLYPFHRQAIGEIVRLGRGRLLGIMALSEVLALAALLFGTIAMSRGPVTLVAALTSVQPFFVLAYALVLTRYFPAVLSEETGPRVLGKKLAAIALMILGAALVA